MRATSRVPSSVGVSCQDQVLSGVVHSSHWFATKLWTFRLVRADGFGDIGTHWPTSMCCRSGMMSVALGCARLSSRSLLYHPARRHPTCTSHGHTASGGAAMLMARVDWYWASSTRPSPGSRAATSAGVAPQRRCQLR